MFTFEVLFIIPDDKQNDVIFSQGTSKLYPSLTQEREYLAVFLQIRKNYELDRLFKTLQMTQRHLVFVLLVFALLICLTLFSLHTELHQYDYHYRSTTTCTLLLDYIKYCRKFFLVLDIKTLKISYRSVLLFKAHLNSFHLHHQSMFLPSAITLQTMV